jgi:hypothetical protein
MNNDKKTISNQWHEIKQAANFLECPAWVIYLAKSKVGNDREAIYSWVIENAEKWRGLI